MIRPTGEVPSNDYNMLSKVEFKSAGTTRKADDKEEKEEDTPMISCPTEVNIFIRIYWNSKEILLCFYYIAEYRESSG